MGSIASVGTVEGCCVSFLVYIHAMSIRQSMQARDTKTTFQIYLNVSKGLLGFCFS